MFLQGDSSAHGGSANVSPARADDGCDRGGLVARVEFKYLAGELGKVTTAAGAHVFLADACSETITKTIGTKHAIVIILTETIPDWVTAAEDAHPTVCQASYASLHH